MMPRTADGRRTFLMKAACFSLALLTVALLVGSLLNNTLFGGINGAFYTSPVLLVPGGILTAVTAACLVRSRPSSGRMGFYLAHGGVLLIVSGALLGWGFGQETTFNIPIDPLASYEEVQISEGELLKFGFHISVLDFRLEYKGEMVSQYRAQLRIEDGEIDEIRSMKVNSPVVYRGWKFYLMDYDHTNGAYVSLHAKKDPGSRIFAAGLWCIIVGTVLICFRVKPPQRKGGGR